MSKKNNDYYDSSGIGLYNQERNNEIADHLEAYVDTVLSLFIIEGKKVKEVDEAIEVVRKAIKNLRNNKPEKVFNLERFEEYMMSLDSK